MHCVGGRWRENFWGASSSLKCEVVPSHFVQGHAHCYPKTEMSPATSRLGNSVLSWVHKVISQWLETWGLRSLSLHVPRQRMIRGPVIKAGWRQPARADWLEGSTQVRTHLRRRVGRGYSTHLGDHRGGHGDWVRMHKPVLTSLCMAVLLKCLLVFPCELVGDACYKGFLHNALTILCSLWWI